MGTKEIAAVHRLFELETQIEREFGRQLEIIIPPCFWDDVDAALSSDGIVRAVDGLFQEWLLYGLYMYEGLQWDEEDEEHQRLEAARTSRLTREIAELAAQLREKLVMSTPWQRERLVPRLDMLDEMIAAARTHPFASARKKKGRPRNVRRTRLLHWLLLSVDERACNLVEPTPLLVASNQGVLAALVRVVLDVAETIDDRLYDQDPDEIDIVWTPVPVSRQELVEQLTRPVRFELPNKEERDRRRGRRRAKRAGGDRTVGDERDDVYRTLKHAIAGYRAVGPAVVFDAEYDRFTQFLGGPVPARK
jgi:hypothetical protein